ncbi:MAG TPA: hypothetical protein VJ044_03615, partial [Candidatus Hodarchaeales archaeon]|nr:hypothetical protein [Candidatus Hodarchaeales archaeon]
SVVSKRTVQKSSLYTRRIVPEFRVLCPHKRQVNFNLKLGENADELTRAVLQEALRQCGE